MLSGKPYQGITTDLWSSGIVLYSMLVGSLPFDEQELQKLYEQIKIGKFYLPSTLSLEAIDFLKKILMVDPKKRIGLNEIKNHAWFKMEKNPMYKGINYEMEQFPCNMKVVSYIIKHYFSEDQDINVDSLANKVKNNAFDKYTATYYLTKKYILFIEDEYKVVEEENNNSKELNKKNMENKNIDKENVNMNIDKNNMKEKIRSNTEENQIIKISDEKEQIQEKKNYPSLIINNNNKSKQILK